MESLISRKMQYCAIIILNYNNYEDTINCICSVEKYNTADVKYIVVDNCSSKRDAKANLITRLSSLFKDSCLILNEDQVVPSSLPRMTILCSETNEGYARGNNKGLLLAQEDVEIDRVLILNSDILFVGDIIPTLSDDLLNVFNCCAVTPILYKRNLVEIDSNCARREKRISDILIQNFLGYFNKLFGINPYERMYYPLRNGGGICPTDLLSGACMMLYKDYFQSIGYFDPHTFLYYEEDILARKFSNTGMKCFVDQNIKAIHLGGASSNSIVTSFLIKEEEKSALYYFKNYRNVSKIGLVVIELSFWFYRISLSLQKTLKVRIFR